MDWKDRTRERWLDCARAFAILSVTMNHAVNRSFNSAAPYVEFTQQPVMISWIHAVIFILSRLGVPVFLMISGVLLLKRDFTDRNVLSRFFRHNMLSVFVTAEIWYAIMFFLMVFVKETDFVSDSPMYILGRLLKNQLFLDQLTMPSMWYIPMILTMYLLIPMIAAALRLFPQKYILACMALVTATAMIYPNVNTYLALSGSGEKLTFALANYPLFSRYMVYMLTGYYLDKGCLTKLKNGFLHLLLAACFAAECVYQHWAFSNPASYSVSYSSFGILIISALLFEVIRRSRISDRIGAVSEYISRRAFGIYFVHICIMVALKALFLEESAGNELMHFMILETAGVLGSLVFIAVLEKISFCRKYLFLIK